VQSDNSTGPYLAVSGHECLLLRALRLEEPPALHRVAAPHRRRPLALQPREVTVVGPAAGLRERRANIN
jgi:hypothetical protein